MGGMLRDDLFLRQIEHLADLVRAFLKGQENGERIEWQLEVDSGLTMADFAALPPHAIVPPLDDVWLRRNRAVGIADALHALGWIDKARRILDVAATWRTQDEVEEEGLLRMGTEASVRLGRPVACVRVTPRSLELAPCERHWWQPSDAPGATLYAWQ